jgi:hypothetical protein
MKRPPRLYLWAYIVGAALLLTIAACENAKSPTEPPGIPASQADASSTGEAQASEGETQAIAEEVNGGSGNSAPICHRHPKGDYRLLMVSPSAIPAHLDHGDVLPGTAGLDTQCQPASATATPTGTPFPTPNTPTSTPTNTALPPASNTPTNTPTDTSLPPASNTPTNTPTDTPVPPSVTPTNTPTNTLEPG